MTLQSFLVDLVVHEVQVVLCLLWDLHLPVVQLVHLYLVNPEE